MVSLSLSLPPPPSLPLSLPPSLPPSLLYSHMSIVYNYSSSSEPSGTTGPLAVVAGDLTLSSVRSFLREAVPGCEEDSTTSCLIVDDMLNLVYDRETFKDQTNSPRFLGRVLRNEDIHRRVVCCHET